MPMIIFCSPLISLISEKAEKGDGQRTEGLLVRLQSLAIH